MGIKGLTALLHEHAPAAFKDHEIKTLFGRKVAIDASMSIYQFLIAVRQKDGELLTNDQGETTSHLMGLFYRTIRMVDNGIKPAYVFDGKPPELKSGVLAQRFQRRKDATEQGEEAKEVGTTEDVDRFSRRTVKVTKEHNEECRRLLKLMGIPCIVAPSEAEAQCAELARGGKVYAAGSEDMDTLTFHSPILFRHLTFSEAKKAPISEVNLEKVLAGLEMDMDQFIELCLLLGCDYLEPIKGVGPKSALKLLREHGSLDQVVKHLREKQAEREGAQKAVEEETEEEVVESEDEWVDAKLEDGTDGEAESSPTKPVKKNKNRIESDESDVDQEMKDASDGEDKKPANEDRVRKGAEKLSKMLNAKQQGRLDGFFTVKPKEAPPAKAVKGKAGGASGKGTKRKADEKDGGGKKTKVTKK
ncbi:Elongation of fatty acids protein 2 [Tulasnella sp. 418]|nr:Elongation of fatty acids protein 2 [Tulasnella sp. 418]